MAGDLSPYIDPHEAVVRTRERELAYEAEQRVGFRWPEDAGIGDPQLFAWQDVVDAEVPGCGVSKVGSVECRIAQMGRVDAALQLRLFCGARTGWRDLRIDPPMLGQLLKWHRECCRRRAGRKSPITRDHEPRTRPQTAALAVVIVDVTALRPGPDVVRPETDLVVISSAVAVFVAVEDRRCCMADQEVDRPARRSRSARPNDSSNSGERVH